MSSRTPSRRRPNVFLVVASLGLAALIVFSWLAADGRGADLLAGIIPGAPSVEATPGSEPADAAMAPNPGIPTDAFEMTVESVHDGDTLRARVSTPNAVVADTESTRVRLIGIDTPEISPELECWGAEATAALSALVPPGSTLWAAPDTEILDRYGRHLLYLWTPDGRFVNAELLADGAGAVMVFDPNTSHEELFRAREGAASAAGLGLWGAC